MEYQIHELSNGLRLAYKQSQNTRISHCGIFADAGSRDEHSHEIGVAHLLEHMFFKGTEKRNLHQVLNRLEVVGGDLNAFTSKDKTCVYASIISDEINRALELLRDVTFYSSFPEKELDREKRVIMEEIDMYLDNPEERIYDEFQELFYAEHALGNNILGSKEELKNMSRGMLVDFKKRTFLKKKLLLVVVSTIDIKRVIRISEKYFGGIQLEDGDFERESPSNPKTFDVEKRNGFLQTHVMMGCPAYSISHEKRPTLMLLSNLLGGPGLNSKLNLSLRERLGYTYSIESNYQSLTDSGLFTVYWSTDKKNYKRSKRAFTNVIDAVLNKPLTEPQLKKYKTQFKGQMIMGEESNLSLFFVLGKSILDLNNFDSLNTILTQIDSITSKELHEVAQEILAPEKRSFLAYIPD